MVGFVTKLLSVWVVSINKCTRLIYHRRQIQQTYFVDILMLLNDHFTRWSCRSLLSSIYIPVAVLQRITIHLVDHVLVRDLYVHVPHYGFIERRTTPSKHQNGGSRIEHECALCGFIP